MVQLSSRQVIKSSRRDEFLGAAAGLFAERGYAGVTMDDIGAAAGVSGPALYHHFSGKEALLGEMLISISEHLLDQGLRTAERHRDPADTLRWLITDQVEFAVDHPELITVHGRDLVHAAEGDRRRIRRLQSRYVEVWVEVIQRLQPQLSEAAARSTAHAAIGLINSTPHSARTSRAEMKPMLTRMALAAIGSASVETDKP
jgi:AcrR family transcriptional regulator